MGTFSVRNIVFVSFPFSDLTDTKLRPALVLANAQKNDWILCQITSKSYADPKAIEINNDNFEIGQLNITSFVRPTKIFTANELLIKKVVGTLNIETHQYIIQTLKTILENGQ